MPVLETVGSIIGIISGIVTVVRAFRKCRKEKKRRADMRDIANNVNRTPLPAPIRTSSTRKVEVSPALAHEGIFESRHGILASPSKLMTELRVMPASRQRVCEQFIRSSTFRENYQDNLLVTTSQQGSSNIPYSPLLMKARMQEIFAHNISTDLVPLPSLQHRPAISPSFPFRQSRIRDILAYNGVN